MNIIALIAFVPAVIITLLALGAFAIKHIMMSLLGSFGVVLGFAGWGAADGFHNLTDAFQFVSGVIWEIIVTAAITIACIAPLLFAAYMYHQHKYTLSVIVLACITVIGIFFFPQLSTRARNWGDVPQGSDSATLVRYNYSSYSKDANHVYFQDTVLESADPKTFTVPGDNGNYALDASHAYYKKTVLDADVSTFTILGAGYYAKDSTHVWWNGELIPQADAGTFEIDSSTPGAEYGKDAHHSFRGTSIVK